MEVLVGMGEGRVFVLDKEGWEGILFRARDVVVPGFPPVVVTPFVVVPPRALTFPFDTEPIDGLGCCCCCCVEDVGVVPVVVPVDDVLLYSLPRFWDPIDDDRANLPTPEAAATLDEGFPPVE